MGNQVLYKVRLSALLIFLAFRASGQSIDSVEHRVTLLFAGDIMGHDTQIHAAEDTVTHTYDYDTVFSYVKPIISEADVAIANLEVTLAGPPYQGYPRFSSPVQLAGACKNAGIDYLVTANNHAADRGIEGITATLHRLDSIGMPHTGTFYNRRAKDTLQPLMIHAKGITIALLNYTYGINGLAVPDSLIINFLDKDQIAGDISEAKMQHPDFIVLFLHWGTEYDTIPSASQNELAEYFLSAGADLIIGSHPHVLQKMEWYKDDTLYADKAVVYSLGNFVSNQRKPKTDGGSMVRIVLTKKNNITKISGAGYFLTWVYTPLINNRKKFFILPCSEFEKKPDFFANPDDYEQMKSFII